jgi:CheY-like chemotaxis protein
MHGLNKLSPILLLEDDVFDVIVLQRSFAAANLDMDLHIVNDGEQALTTLGLLQQDIETKIHPSIAILDINVPRISGFDVCRQIRLKPELQNLPIVFFSGSTSENDEKSAFEAGADDYFDKNKGPHALIEYLQSQITDSA